MFLLDGKNVSELYTELNLLTNSDIYTFFSHAAALYIHTVAIPSSNLALRLRRVYSTNERFTLRINELISQSSLIQYWYISKQSKAVTPNKNSTLKLFD